MKYLKNFKIVQILFLTAGMTISASVMAMDTPLAEVKRLINQHNEKIEELEKKWSNFDIMKQHEIKGCLIKTLGETTNQISAFLELQKKPEKESPILTNSINSNSKIDRTSKSDPPQTKEFYLMVGGKVKVSFRKMYSMDIELECPAGNGKTESIDVSPILVESIFDDNGKDAMLEKNTVTKYWTFASLTRLKYIFQEGLEAAIESVQKIRDRDGHDHDCYWKLDSLKKAKETMKKNGLWKE